MWSKIKAWFSSKKKEEQDTDYFFSRDESNESVPAVKVSAKSVMQEVNKPMRSLISLKEDLKKIDDELKLLDQKVKKTQNKYVLEQYKVERKKLQSKKLLLESSYRAQDRLIRTVQ